MPRAGPSKWPKLGWGIEGDNPYWEMRVKKRLIRHRIRSKARTETRKKGVLNREILRRKGWKSACDSVRRGRTNRLFSYLSRERRARVIFVISKEEGILLSR